MPQLVVQVLSDRADMRPALTNGSLAMTMTTRRAMLGATAAFAAIPALPTMSFAALSTPATAGAVASSGAIRRLWDEVIDLSIRLGDHPTPIVHGQSGLPGWMYDRGEANALGHARYEKLMEILRSQPRTSEDLAIVARAASHVDVENGPRTYGAARLAIAAQSMAA